MKPHALLEYLWVSKNISIAGERVIDAGAHHGHYSLFFSSFTPKPDWVKAVEPLPANCALIEVNSSLNGSEVQVLEAAISNHAGHDTFIPRSNGRLFPGVGIKVSTLPLSEVDPTATLVKLDIEGTEFTIIPSQIDLMENVHTWIIEVHPNYGDPRALVDQFRERGFTISFLDKFDEVVSPYHSRYPFNQSTTIFCLKDPKTS
jgi:FkbM family methyltransferase